MKLTKLAIALALTSSASLAHAVDASDVTLSNGGNVETAISQQAGQISGLGSDVLDLYSTTGNLQTQVNAKVAQADFNADQQRQDGEIQAAAGIANDAYDRTQALETHANQTDANVAQNKIDQAVTDAAQETRIDANATAIGDNKAAQDAVNTRQARTNDVTDGKIEVTNQRIDEDRSKLADHDSRITANADNVKSLDTQVNRDRRTADDRAAAQLTVDESQNGAISDVGEAVTKETNTRTTQFNTLQSGVAQAQSTGDYANSRVDAANANIEANRTALNATNKRVAQNTADIASHEQRITSLESQNNAQFGKLKNEIDDNRKRASAGIAGVAAMANIPQVLEHQTFAIGAGAGNTDGESALAVGFSARASQNTVVKASVSNDTQHNFVVGAGVSYGW